MFISVKVRFDQEQDKKEKGSRHKRGKMRVRVVGMFEFIKAASWTKTDNGKKKKWKVKKMSIGVSIISLYKGHSSIQPQPQPPPRL